jgi:hypothetical protein
MRPPSRRPAAKERSHAKRGETPGRSRARGAAPDAAAGPQQVAAQMGNRGFAQWLQAQPVPALAQQFGIAPGSVNIRGDDLAARRAVHLGARGYSEGNDIGIAPGLGAAQTEQTLAHELAHVAQRRGGNTATAWPVRTLERAELQADHAATAVTRGARPQLGAFQSPGVLLNGRKPKRGAPSKYKFTVQQVQQWRSSGKDVLYQIYRVHVLNLYPGATEQDIASCLATLGALYYTGDLAADLKLAQDKNRGVLPVNILPQLHGKIKSWIKTNKKVDVGDLDLKESGSPDGKKDAEGGGGTGEGSGAGAGKGEGTGAGTKEGENIGLSSEAGTQFKAPSLDEALKKVQEEVEAAKPTVTTREADGKDHIWPAEVSDPEQRKNILQVMKDIVGEAMKLPEDEKSEVPARLKSAEAAFLLKIATSDEDTRAAIIAKLKGSGELKGDSGQTLAETLDTAIANVELEKHAGELGVEIEKTKSTDPSKKPIENRPVHGRIVNLSGALSPGERSVWKFRVEDDRDAFRVPHIYVAWAAFRQNQDGSTGEEVSSENTHAIPVRDQGLLNDSEFDFTVRETGGYIVKAIVNHNFFRPAYFEEPFVVEDEFLQSDRQFTEGHGDLIDKDKGWDPELFGHGGEFDYRLGRKRYGTLKADVHATTNAELAEQLERQKAAMRKSIDALIAADPSRKEALEDAFKEREKEIDEQIDKIRTQGGTVALVARGQFVSRVREVEDATLSLACTLAEVTAPDGKSTWFKAHLHDATPRASRKVNHFESAPSVSVEGAQRDLFLQVAEAYPFGTVTVLFQGYNHQANKPTRNFVQFQKRTDTLAKDIKAKVFDETVDTLVNVVGFVLTLFPPTTAVGITLLVAYNTSKAISENVDDWETGNFEKKKAGIALADLVINLLPLAPQVVKVGKASYYVIKAASLGGTAVLMTAVGLEQVRQLRANNIDVLARKMQEYEKLKKDNPANPLIAKGTLLAEIEKLKKDTANATKDVFGQLAAQAVFMHAVSTGIEKGLGGLKPGPVETRLLPAAKARSKAVGGLEEAGLFKHAEGAKPRYDYNEGKIVGDGATIKEQRFNTLAKEAAADRALGSAGVSKADRAKVGGDVAKAGADVRKGLSTQVIRSADGTPVLIVREGATAPEIRTALKDVKPATPSKRFVPVKEPASAAQQKLGRVINDQLTPTARQKLGEVSVEIVPEGSFGPGKTRAQVVHAEGKTVVRFEGEPRPGVVAEEIAHLEQLADPKFSEQTKLLAQASGKDWSSFSDAKKVEAHKARLVLEIDAQKRAIDQLLARPAPKDKGRLLTEVADVDAAYQNLEQLRHNLGETLSLAEQARAGSLQDRPSFIDQRPMLTNKKTTNKFPLPEGWTKMTQDQFVKKYREMYPDTTLTVKELRDRHRNGMRLNPETGRLKDPTLVDDPVPDIRALKENRQAVPVDDLKLSKADKQRMKDLLAKRDKARADRDKALGKGDEEAAAGHARDVNEASRQLGEEHAKAYMKEKYPDFEQLYPSDPTKPSRAGDFDQVWVKYGKNKRGKKVVVQVIVIEAKGGAGTLGTRKAGGLVVQQGTGAYFESIIASMEKGTPEMNRIAAMLKALKPSEIEYKLVIAPIEMTRDAKPRSQVLAVEVADFNLAKTLKP